MASVVFENATRIYPGTTKPAVDKLNLTVKDGEFLVLVGPSGCGKSTSLRMLAGLEEVNEGHIRIGDRDVTDVPPKDRDIAMVFQNYALYPHMTVAENMGFALKIAGVSKEEREAHVLCHGHVWVESVVLEDHCDVAVFWWNVGYVAVTDKDVAFVNLFKTCKHAQGR